MGMIDLIIKGGPVALIIVGFAFLWYVIGQMDNKFNKEIERLEKEMSTRLESRLNVLDGKIDILTIKVTELIAKGGLK